MHINGINFSIEPFPISYNTHYDNGNYENYFEDDGRKNVTFSEGPPRLEDDGRENVISNHKPQFQPATFIEMQEPEYLTEEHFQREMTEFKEQLWDLIATSEESIKTSIKDQSNKFERELTQLREEVSIMICQNQMRNNATTGRANKGRSIAPKGPSIAPKGPIRINVPRRPQIFRERGHKI